MDHFHHQTVLLEVAVDQLQLRQGGRWLDGTLGGGGHAERILDHTGPDGLLVGIDRDAVAIAAASARLARFGSRFVPRHGRFGDMARLASPWAPFDGLLLDLGVSSPQLDHAERGFSLRLDADLDMRMDRSQGPTAAELLDELDLDGLVDILRRYGDEPRARRIAQAVLQGRPWRRTVALADCIARASGYHGGRTHPATRSFQALRIAVNDELGELQRALDAAPDLLAPGGRFVVISFHSLEDRLVKHHFRQLAGVDAPRDEYGRPQQPPAWRLVTRKALHGQELDPSNPRARSAQLRVLERLPEPPLS